MIVEDGNVIASGRNRTTESRNVCCKMTVFYQSSSFVLFAMLVFFVISSLLSSFNVCLFAEISLLLSSFNACLFSEVFLVGPWGFFRSESG